MNRKIFVGIPVRMASTRFPGKPVFPILGKTMMEHIYHRINKNNLNKTVFFALCDEQTRQEAVRLNAPYRDTNPNIERPILRVAEAIKAYDCAKSDLVVIVQGDEPLVHPDMLEEALKPFFEENEPLCSCLCSEIDKEEADDPNVIKIVKNLKGDCLYMSRNILPSTVHPEYNGKAKYLKQVCIMAFTLSTLTIFNSLPSTNLEKAESIELLRAIEHGYTVKMVETRYKSQAVDTPADIETVEKILKLVAAPDNLNS